MTQAQTAWLRPASVAQPSLKADGDAEISGSLNTTGGAILNTAGAATGLIVASGNVGIGTTTPAYKLDVAGFFKVEPPGVTQTTYDYQITKARLDDFLYPLIYESSRCSWAPNDTIWENPPSPDAVPVGDDYCYDINKTVIKATLGSFNCSQSTTPATNQCPCDTGGSNFQCQSALGVTCGQESGEIQLASPLTVGECYDRGNSGTRYDTYYLYVMMRYYTKVTSTPWGKVSIGSSSQYNNLCLNGDCRTSWPASSSGGGGTVTSVATGAGLTGGPITTSGTISVNAPSCSGSTEKLLWNGSAFTCGTDQSSGSGSDGLGTGNSGNTGYITKWTGSTSIGDSIIQDNGTSIGIGSVPPSGYKLNAEGVSGRSGVRGASTGGGYGVTGTTDTGIGVYGVSSSGSGVYGDAASTIAVGVRGRNSALGGFAGYFDGDVAVTGKIKMRVDTVAYQATGPNTPGFYKITSGSGPTCTSTERGSMFIGRVSPQSTQDALCVCIDVDSAMNYWCLNP